MDFLEMLDIKRSAISCDGCGDRKRDDSLMTFKVSERLDVKVIGSGDELSLSLLENTRNALTERGADFEIEYITSIEKAFELGVLGTPALMINGSVLSSSRVMTKDEILSHILD